MCIALGLSACALIFPTLRDSLSVEVSVLDGVLASKPSPQEGANTEVQLRVQSLALILNKQEYELAKASVSHVNLHVAARYVHAFHTPVNQSQISIKTMGGRREQQVARGSAYLR